MSQTDLDTPQSPEPDAPREVIPPVAALPATPPVFSLNARPDEGSRLKGGLSLMSLSVMALIVVVASAIFWFAAGQLPIAFVLGVIVLAAALVIGVNYLGFAKGERAPASEGLKTDQLLQALSEPAAIIAHDGRIMAVNPAWTSAGGHPKRLPSGSQAPGLYVAMLEAAKKGEGRTQIRLGDQDMDVVLASLGDQQVLMRASTARILGAGIVAEAEAKSPESHSPPPALPPVSGISGEGMSGFDEFVLAAPFGQALLRGPSLFESRILTCNPAFAKLCEKPQSALIGEVFGALIDEAARDEASERLIEHPAKPFDIRLSANREKPIHMFITLARPDANGERAVMAYLFDISEQKQLEQSLAQVQKMQAIGQFAGGVAHDLNNLLTGLKLRVEELLHNHPLGDPSYDGLNEIRQISTRAEDLVRKLLAFSRKQTVKRVTLNLGELISEFEVLLRRLMREDVKLETEYGRDLPNIHADKGQMEMAVMNLVVNARDALASSGGGKVKIRTATLSQAQAIEQGWSDCPEQGAALIEVTDNGPGITPEIMTKVFEPFFTTKPLGEGTGLGLATVYGIVNQADGHIALSSVVAPAAGHGATFRIFLPIRIDVPKLPGEAPEAPAAPPKVTPKDISGTGKILFVEDEEIVRGIAARLLRQRGYEVIEACDGEEALEIIIAENGKFDLLISDVIMPGLDGPSMLKKARPLLGNVPVMFISGYAEADFSDLLEDETGISFLPKPLDIKTLAEKVKEQLSGGGA